MSKILITDSHFLAPGHAGMKLLEDAGHTITRIDKLKAEPDELMEALADKDGYILGGIEQVTSEIITAAPGLRAISFTGSGYKDYIPGWETATDNGVAISAAIGRNANSVAQWALSASLHIIRKLTELTTPVANGGTSFAVAREFESLTLGLVGYGNISRSFARMASGLGFRVIVTDSALARDDYATVVELEQLLAEADVVSVHISKSRGTAALDAAAINSLKNGAIVVNAAFPEAIDNTALLQRVAAGDLTAALDYSPDISGLTIPVGGLLASNAQTGFNTTQANDRVSIRTAQAMVNLLATGFDVDLVNPTYLSNLNT